MRRARFLRPLATADAPVLPSLSGLASLPWTVVAAVGGMVPSESVAAELEARTPAWLRLDPLDRRADVLARSLSAAASEVGECGAGAGTEAEVRPPSRPRTRSPTHLLPDELTRGRPLVVEDPYGLAHRTSLIELRPDLERRSVPVVVVTHHRIPLRWRRRFDRGRRAGGAAGRPSPGGSTPLARELLGPDVTDRLERLLGARPALWSDVLRAVSSGGVAEVSDAAGSTRRLDRFLHRLTALLLTSRPPETLLALEHAARTGSWSPGEHEVGELATAGLRPWMIPLECGHWWLRPAWRTPLQRQLGGVATHELANPRTRAGPPVTDNPTSTPETRRSRPRPPPWPESSTVAANGRTRLQARLLGGFDLRIDGRSVERWIGQRGPMVLKYLLTQPEHSAPRDVLLDVFWPDVEPAKARNRLHVALRALRRGLATVTDVTVIEFHGGSYRIAADIDVEVDVDEFEHHAAEGRRSEADGDPDAAVTHYEKAVHWYGGPFLAEHPYEEWTVLPRASLELAHLDALNRLAELHIVGGRLEECVMAAQRILDHDPCHEEAHRLIMRCFAQQGRCERAMRQYELCRRALSTRLELEPSAETQRLHRSIAERTHDP